jgi:hypothetical protein
MLKRLVDLFGLFAWICRGTLWASADQKTDIIRIASTQSGLPLELYSLTVGIIREKGRVKVGWVGWFSVGWVGVGGGVDLSGKSGKA